MKVIIHNPKIATPLIAYDMEYLHYSNAQVITQVEKALKARSKICDKITIEPTENKSNAKKKK